MHKSGLGRRHVLGLAAGLAATAGLPRRPAATEIAWLTCRAIQC
jgi:hypothetical protein